MLLKFPNFPFRYPFDIGNVSYSPTSGEYPHNFKLAIDGVPLQEGTLLHSGSFSVLTYNGNRPEDDGVQVAQISASAPLGKTDYVSKAFRADSSGNFGDIYSYFISKGCQYIDVYLYGYLQLGKSRMRVVVSVGTFLLVKEPVIDLSNDGNMFSNILRADKIHLAEATIAANTLVSFPFPLNIQCEPIIDIKLNFNEWFTTRGPFELIQPFKTYFTKSPLTIPTQIIENFHPEHFINYQNFGDVTVYMFRSVRYIPYNGMYARLIYIVDNKGRATRYTSPGTYPHGCISRMCNPTQIGYQS